MYIPTAAPHAQDDVPSGRQRSSRTQGRAVRVLDLDPELMGDLSPGERARAVATSGAATVTWFPGEQPPLPDLVSVPGSFGLLVLEGVLALRISRGERVRAELLGPEDLLRPWVTSEDWVDGRSTFTWEMLGPVRLAVLDRRFAAAMAPWPTVLSRLLDRQALRARRLCLQMTTASSPRGEERVGLLLWMLAERWGKVTPRGVVLPFPLTHRLLAEMTGSRRPTVTSAVVRLRREGLISTLADHRFILHRSPSDAGFAVAGALPV